MKKLITLSIALLAGGGLLAQKIEVREGRKSFDNGSQNAMTVMVYHNSVKEVEKAWKDVLKGMKAKVSMKKEIFADDATLAALGENTFDVYTRMEAQKDGGGIAVSVAVDLGGAYLNSGEHSSKYKAFEDLLLKFGRETTTAGINTMIKNEEKILKGFEKEQKDLEKENEKMVKSIEDNEKAIERAKKAIEDAKKSIEKNKGDQEKKKGEIATQTQKVAKTQEMLKAVK